MKFEEISKELNIPLRRVRKIYFKGMDKLRKRLTPEEKEYLRDLLSDIDNKDPSVDLLSEILYNPYGKDNF